MFLTLIAQLKVISLFKKKTFLFAGFFLSIFLSCGIEDSKKDSKALASLTVENFVAKGEVEIVEPIADEEVVVLLKDGLSLTEIKVDKHQKATIQMNTKKISVGKNKLRFSVDGIEDYSISYLANNYFLAQFKADFFEVELLNGNNVFLTFLTDEHNISIKTNKGSMLKNAVLGGVQSLFDMNDPHLFYYLPQAITQEPILDFYLINSSISENGNKVKVTINETEFIIHKWAAYRIDGLKNAENTVRIQLLDKNMQLIAGPFNDSGDRRLFIQSLTHI